MLDAEGVHNFFNAIEEEPLDLLGPAHQRLVMCCLSEVPRDIELPRRKDLERGLSEWLLFEYELRGSVHLAWEMEFPEQALDAAFREGSDEMKKEVLKATPGRAAIPLNILEVGASWLGDKDLSFQEVAVKALCNQSALPDKILKAVAAHEVWEVRRAAEATLRNQRDFYHNLLNGPHVISLYSILFRLNFQEQLAWYIEDGDSCVNMPDDIRRISISDHDNYVKTIINARPANYPSIFSK